MKPKVIILLVLVALILIIMAQNTYVINLHLLFWTVSMSQIILIAFTLLSGFIIGYITSVITYRGSKRKF